MTLALCPTFEQLAERTVAYLDAGEDTAIGIGETTMTDVNLVEIQVRHRDRVRTAKFAAHQERANGADWEWWFVEGGYTQGLRVQAKRQSEDGIYRGLWGKGRQQLQVLRQESEMEGLVPLYCFWNRRTEIPEWPLSTPATAHEQMGAAVATADALDARLAVESVKSVASLARIQRPWRDLVCRGADQGLGALHELLRDWLTKDVPASLPKDLPAPRPLQDAPRYVQGLLAGEVARPIGMRELLPARRVALIDLDGTLEGWPESN